MSINRFLKDLTNTVAGGAERRFARDLARTLGVHVEEPSHGTKPTSTRQPAATPQPAAEPEAERYSAGFPAGKEHGLAWGFNRAYRSDLQRLVEWVDTVRGEFTAQDVAAVVFPKPIGEWMKHDADRLLAGEIDYVRGFVVGGMLVWAHQLAAEQSKA
jgi:hypothetical protein